MLLVIPELNSPSPRNRNQFSCSKRAHSPRS